MTIMRITLNFKFGLLALLGGCAPDLIVVSEDPSDSPLANLPPALQKQFDDGDALFEQRYFASQGLGPLYIRTSCVACHADDGKGPGFVNKMVVLDDDGVSIEAALPFGHTVRPFRAAGALTGITAPDTDGLVVSTRIGPPVHGRGFLEAVRDDEIERVATEQAAAGEVSGRINRVVYASERNAEALVPHEPGDLVIGRFGLKARVASLDDFTADALQGDMGLTSPMRPLELPNPDGLEDDERAGIDIDLDDVNAIAVYTRLLDIPNRDPSVDATELFAGTGCAACHVPTLRTRADHPVEAFADIDAPVFTDMLLHDMGEALADGIVDGDATGSEWRTAPLIGLRFMPGYLHDGRADTVDDAIRLHAGEASASAARYAALDDDARALLLSFVESL